MNSIKTFAIASCLGMLSMAFLPSAKADEWNKRTILTVNEPLALPNTVLQPGKYVIKLLDSTSNRNIVQVFNERESKLITTILAIPDYQITPAGKTEFAFWETPAGQPRALKAWFYPGDNFGQEFAYPKEMAQQIANVNNQPVPSAANENSQVEKVNPEPQQQAQAQPPQEQAPPPAPPAAEPQTNPAPPETAQVTPPAPEQTPAPAAQPQTTPAPRENLPRTASPYPLIGLAGLLSLGVALALRAARNAA